MEIKFNKTYDTSKEVTIHMSLEKLVIIKHNFEDLLFAIERGIDRDENGVWINNHFITKVQENDIRTITEEIIDKWEKM